MWLPLHVRQVIPIDGAVEIYFDGPPSYQVRVLGVTVRGDGRIVAEATSSLFLAGDGGIYGEFDRLAELVPPTHSKRYAHRRVPAEVHTSIDPDEVVGLIGDMDHLGKTLVDWTSEYPPMGQVPVRVDLPAVLRERPGETIELEVEVRYIAPGGRLQSAFVAHRVQVLPDFPRMPLAASGNGILPSLDQSGTWYTGDFHVHDCKDEAGFWRGCPTCQAESVNWGSDFSLAQLKTQFTALGADWFTSSSHSYCLESSTEYRRVFEQVLTLNEEPGSMIFPDVELTSSESGPRQGCLDLNDLICAIDGGVNHMGAHFVRSWKAGGTGLAGGYCLNPIYPILDNIAAIRAEGGITIINHPCYDPDLGGALVSNSDQAIVGIRQEGLHGAEIWGGSSSTGQGSHVEWWTDRLLEGKKIYAFSGSDTHDSAFDFGWNHVYVRGELEPGPLRNSVARGLSYISSYQYLAVAGREIEGTWLPMGSDVLITAGESPIAIEVVIAYDMGNRTGNVEVYRGRTGDDTEERIANFEDIAGDGYLFVTDDAPTDRTSYYRAYSEAPGSPRTGVAYSNPIWFNPR